MITSSAARALIVAFGVAAQLGLASNARASQTYPANIEAYWRISSLPVGGQGCKLCHSSELGGTGTVVQPFGKAMQAQGLMPEDPTSLYKALAYVTQHSVVKPILDSDGDGVPDYNEIHDDHTNPNDPKSFVAPTVMMPSPSNGGEGGDGPAGSVEGGAAGQRGLQTPEPPVFEPPAAADLPPPFVHGCALAPATGGAAGGLTLLFATIAFVRRRARRHAGVRRHAGARR